MITLRNIRKISVYLFPIFRTNTKRNVTEHSTTLKLKTKEHSLLEMISPSFSMLNFHFRTQTEEKKCFYQMYTLRCLVKTRNEAGYKYKWRIIATMRCACNMRHSSQAESKIAIQTSQRMMTKDFSLIFRELHVVKMESLKHALSWWKTLHFPHNFSSTLLRKLFERDTTMKMCIIRKEQTQWYEKIFTVSGQWSFSCFGWTFVLKAFCKWKLQHYDDTFKFQGFQTLRYWWNLQPTFIYWFFK